MRQWSAGARAGSSSISDYFWNLRRRLLNLFGQDEPVTISRCCHSMVRSPPKLPNGQDVLLGLSCRTALATWATGIPQSTDLPADAAMKVSFPGRRVWTPDPQKKFTILAIQRQVSEWIRRTTWAPNITAPSWLLSVRPTARDCTQGLLDQLLDSAPRMLGQYPRVCREVMEHLGLGINLAAHHWIPLSFRDASMTKYLVLSLTGFCINLLAIGSHLRMRTWIHRRLV